MDQSPPEILLSIHDVMPETLDDVQKLLELIAGSGLAPPALLVVPGRNWQHDEITQLRAWVSGGCELIAHGWHHHTKPTRLRHRLHALLLSRNVAEHLAFDRDEIVALMQRSQDWFSRQGLPRPTTYIPPAWALGLSPRELTLQPFDHVETLSGLYSKGSGTVRFKALPLLGFEADNGFRALFLRLWNGLQRRQAQRRGRPLRISIHPHDGELRLRKDLETILASRWTCLHYDQIAS
ncbi:DUF2334 domain-containing protein [Congregibacter sp.]|uniref:DUF2334 domain-containing protein n=1 Tax=Congregibacter sp. TaxID=2744308 RepID=UPI003F6A888C